MAEVGGSPVDDDDDDEEDDDVPDPFGVPAGLESQEVW